MKKLLFIALTLFSLQSFAQDTTYVKVRGIPGAYNFSKNDSGDSLIFYVAGVRNALSVGTVTDLSNYYNKTAIDDSLAKKLDSSYHQSLVGINPIYFEVINPDSANIKIHLDTTSTLSDYSDTTVTTSKSVKNYVDAQISSITGGTSTLIAVKSDDTAAFAALSNGNGAYFEVGGEISYYAKSSTGVQKKLTLPNF